MRNPFKIERHGGSNPYVWYGMRFGNWFRLLADGRFDITLNCVPRILAVSLVAPLNSALYHVSQLAYGRRIEETEVKPPIFIIGHWRTGTTLLHELLDCDPRFDSPTTYQCMFPESFLLTDKLVSRISSGAIEMTRSFDNMILGPDYPQEEEFGILNSGMGTPYQTLAFPRHGPTGLDYIDVEALPEQKREPWEQAYMRLVKRFQFRHDRPLVLKSPVHGGRIRTLLKLFPDARFIYTARDPFDVYVSHKRMLKILMANQGLHNPIPTKDDWPRDYLLDTFDTLFETYERDRGLIPAGRLAELRYEDLVADPRQALRSLYETLDLGPLGPAEPAIEAYLDKRRDYQRNVNRLDPAERDLVERRWGRYRKRFGYTVPVE